EPIRQPRAWRESLYPPFAPAQAKNIRSGYSLAKQRSDRGGFRLRACAEGSGADVRGARPSVSISACRVVFDPRFGPRDTQADCARTGSRVDSRFLDMLIDRSKLHSGCREGTMRARTANVGDLEAVFHDLSRR